MFEFIIYCLSMIIATASETYKDPHFAPGHVAIVHLFEWKWLDIAEECERFLGPMGYGGVQTSPIQENLIIPSRPWWERYQPMSYKWETRSGSSEDFKNMVKRCNKANVRIYVDVVFNHMTVNLDNPSGTGGSTADTYQFKYPEVPYSKMDFHTLNCNVDNYLNPINVRNCELLGLHDLDQSKEHVRLKIVGLMNDAIDTGVAGFRIDAAKHMWPIDLNIIWSRLKNLNTEHGFENGARPYIYQEVIDYGGEGVSKYEYNPKAAVTEFRYGSEVSNSFKGNNYLKWFVTWGELWGLLPSKDALVFIDNHDTQRGGSVLNYKSPKLYKMAVAFMLAHPYGNPQVMSSFDFNNFDKGPPADSQERILSPVINSDNTCGNGWICEHRWRQIYNMVGFRNVANNTCLENWWDNGKNQIAFCRGNVGFIAINAEQFDMKIDLESCLTPGVYCDVISGALVNGKCTGKEVKVNTDKMMNIQILTSDEDGVLAIHTNAKLQSQ